MLLCVIEQTSPFIPPSPLVLEFDLHQPVEFSKCSEQALSVLIGKLASLTPLSVHGKKGS